MDFFQSWKNIGPLIQYSLEAPHFFQTLLLENGCKIGLGNIIDESIIAEDDRTLTSRIEFLMLSSDTEGQRLHSLVRDLFIETNENAPGSDGMYRLAGNDMRFDRNAEVQSKL
jgi:hypothetical protein